MLALATVGCPRLQTPCACAVVQSTACLLLALVTHESYMVIATGANELNACMLHSFLHLKAWPIWF